MCLPCRPVGPDPGREPQCRRVGPCLLNPPAARPPEPGRRSPPGPAKPYPHRPAPGATGPEGLGGTDPFILQADGKGWLFAPSGLVDGPLDAPGAKEAALEKARATGYLTAFDDTEVES